MGRPKIGAEYKKPSDYSYDFPENRKLGEKLYNGDFSFIAERTGYSRRHVSRVLINGTRNNERITSIARKIVELREMVSIDN